ncbi:MAG: NAD(P)/FAD-dependent oxidoreductase [Nocardioidaceae bacterium]
MVIIGGGIIGSVAAYELARAGVQVTLLERSHVAAQQSGRNWGFIRQQGRSSTELPLMRNAILRWQTLEAELDADLGWTQGGCLTLAEDAAAASRLQSWIPVGEAFGSHSRMVGPAEVDTIVPGLRGTLLSGLYCPDDGHADPDRATRAFADAAGRCGADVRTGQPVISITTDRGRVTGVTLPSGHVAADVVVCAAGAGSRQLLRTCGVALPQSFVYGTVALTTPLPPITDAAVWTAGLAFRQRRDGSCVVSSGPGGEVHVGMDTFAVAPHFLSSLWTNRSRLRLRVGRRLTDQLNSALRGDRSDPHAIDGSPLPNLRRVRRSLRRFTDAVPGAATASVASAWAGVIDATPDATPIISKIDAVAGLVVAAGFSGHGFGLGVPAGEAAAALTTDDAPAFDLQGFRFSRFAERDFRPADGIV